MVLGRIEAMEEYRIFDILTIKVELWLHNLLQHLIGIDVQWGSASQQAEGRYEPYKPECVVTMQVRDKYMVYE
jgi:hypothetical protein